MDTIKAIFAYLAVPLAWSAGIVRNYPKGTLIAWLVSLAIVAWLV